jgi:hypothetical protein
MSPGNGTTKGTSVKADPPLSSAEMQDIKQSDKTEVHPNGLTSRNRHGGQKSMNNTARV